MATMRAAGATTVPAPRASDLAGLPIVTPWPGRLPTWPGPAIARRRYHLDVTLYRDPLAGLHSQIATKRGLLESRDRALAPIHLAMLPERLRKVLSRPREALRVASEAADLDELASVERALDELLAAHDEAATLVPKLRECPDEVPDPPKPKVSPPWAIEEPAQLAFRAMLTRRLAEISPDAYLVRWGDTTYLTRVRIAGAPVVLTSHIGLLPGQPTTPFRSTARTSVPRSTPSLHVRPRRLLGRIGRALRIPRGLETDQRAFDDAFVVRGDPAGVWLLSSDVIGALLELRRLQPRLSVRRGVAELVWGDGYVRHEALLLHDQAIAAVLGIRAVIERS